MSMVARVIKPVTELGFKPVKALEKDQFVVLEDPDGILRYIDLKHTIVEIKHV